MIAARRPVERRAARRARPGPDRRSHRSAGDSAPDETVAAYGPNVPFTVVFPIAGQYRLWIQVERHNAVLTVPVVFDVAGPAQGTQR